MTAEFIFALVYGAKCCTGIPGMIDLSTLHAGWNDEPYDTLKRRVAGPIESAFFGI